MKENNKVTAFVQRFGAEVPELEEALQALPLQIDDADLQIGVIKRVQTVFGLVGECADLRQVATLCGYAAAHRRPFFFLTHRQISPPEITGLGLLRLLMFPQIVPGERMVRHLRVAIDQIAAKAVLP